VSRARSSTQLHSARPMLQHCPFSPQVIDTKVDIWAVGCIVYQLLFKKHPFRNAAIITDNWKLPRGRTTKEPLVLLLSECLQLMPADRPTAPSLVACFDAIADGNPLPTREYGQAVVAKPATSPVRPPQAAREEAVAPGTPTAVMAKDGVMMRVRVRRGAQGLGFALNADNRVATLVKGGQAEADGLIEVSYRAPATAPETHELAAPHCFFHSASRGWPQCWSPVGLTPNDCDRWTTKLSPSTMFGSMAGPWAT
jgi:hypothetical protein